MTHSTTILHQLLALLPEQQFQTFVGQHEADKYVKKFSCFNQLTTLLYAQITGKECLREIESDLRMVTFADEDGEIYEYLTDEFRLSAANIAEIYRRRWDIETFFRWIKQNLKIKTFLGTSQNAVMIQIWVAMIYYLLLKWLSHCMNFRGSLTTLARKIAVFCMHQFQLFEVLGYSEKGLKLLYKARAGPQMSIF